MKEKPGLRKANRARVLPHVSTLGVCDQRVGVARSERLPSMRGKRSILGDCFFGSASR